MHSRAGIISRAASAQILAFTAGGRARSSMVYLGTDSLSSTRKRRRYGSRTFALLAHPQSRDSVSVRGPSLRVELVACTCVAVERRSAVRERVRGARAGDCGWRGGLGSRRTWASSCAARVSMWAFLSNAGMQIAATMHGAEARAKAPPPSAGFFPEGSAYSVRAGAAPALICPCGSARWGRRVLMMWGPLHASGSGVWCCGICVRTVTTLFQFFCVRRERRGLGPMWSVFAPDFFFCGGTGAILLGERDVCLLAGGMMCGAESRCGPLSLLWVERTGSAVAVCDGVNG
ncbi:hypothetical protein C8R44DRAFT_298802 [Mycena epipterygia]|nr:hypothetical protein C8R44DRAFT_298802 [Mycena epipterygia]